MDNLTDEPRKKTSYFPLNPGSLIGILISWFMNVYEIIPISLGRKCHPLSNTQPTRGPCFFHCSHGEVSSNLSVFPSLTSGTVQALKDRISDATSSCANRLEQIEYMSNIYI